MVLVKDFAVKRSFSKSFPVSLAGQGGGKVVLEEEEVLVFVVEVAEALYGGEGGGRQDRRWVRGTCGLPCSSIFMPPRRSPSARGISLISLSDLQPKFLVLSISASGPSG